MRPLLNLIPIFALCFAACTSLEQETTHRGPLEKADAVGSCALESGGDSCGGPAALGNCWCDDACEIYGDCCSDKADVCDGSQNLCEDFVPPCQSDSDCGEGFECVTEPMGCNPSNCSCDPQTGAVMCTADCSGKICQPKVDLCEDFVPPCQSDAECGPGFICAPEPGGCNPSSCGCNPENGIVMCTADCGGNICQPEADLCCSLDDQPGSNGNPTCFEGATCCADGQWHCNLGNGMPACPQGLGQVCSQP